MNEACKRNGKLQEIELGYWSILMGGTHRGGRRRRGGGDGKRIRNAVAAAAVARASAEQPDATMAMINGWNNGSIVR